MRFRLIERQLKEIANSNFSNNIGEYTSKKFFDNFISMPDPEAEKKGLQELKRQQNSTHPSTFAGTDYPDIPEEDFSGEVDIKELNDVYKDIDSLSQTLEEINSEPDGNQEEDKDKISDEYQISDEELTVKFDDYDLNESEKRLLFSDPKKLNLARRIIYLNEMVDFNDPKYKDFNPEGSLLTVGNDKVGEHMLIFNMTSAAHCPSLLNGMCQVIQNGNKNKIACYAYQDEQRQNDALKLRIRQMKFWKTSSIDTILNEFRNFMNNRIAEAKNGSKKPVPTECRFNQSGDMDSVEDVKKLAAVGKMLLEEYGMQTYTYTARRDLKKHFGMFKNPNPKPSSKYSIHSDRDYVVIQGSGFYASDTENVLEPEVFSSRKDKIKGKTFKAFPSKAGLKPEKIDKNTVYLEDLEKNRFHVTKNPNGWVFCPGDCRKCHLCKINWIPNIAVRIHRSFGKRNYEMESDPMDYYKKLDRSDTRFQLYTKLKSEIDSLTPEKLEKLQDELLASKSFSNHYSIDEILKTIDKKIENIVGNYMKKKQNRDNPEKMTRYRKEIADLNKDKTKLKKFGKDFNLK